MLDNRMITRFSRFSTISKFIICTVILLICSEMGQCSEKWVFDITAQCRPGTYWWCPGSAFDKESIDWNLEKISEAGFGTAHVIPIYGAEGYEDRYIEYLSSRWMRMYEHIVGKAGELGVQVDMSTGSGWCFGGPDIDEQYRDSRVRWQKDTAEIETVAGMRVKRAAPGGEGPMLNPFSPDAMTFYLERFSSAFTKSASTFPRAQYHDSFEYKANWSWDFLKQFQQRRGYNLKPHFDNFFGETTDTNREIKRRLKYDYRLTLSELHLEYIQTWARWSKKNGMLTRNQAHGGAANLLDVYAVADIAETEMFGAPDFAIPGFRRDAEFCREGDSNPLIMKLASSAAHVTKRSGEQLVSSESFTWLREHWHGTLGQMKLSADLFFLAGVNHMFYHGTCYSAKDAPWPGWFFYASTKADWRNSIWRDIGYLNEYVARCQSVLQAGEAANDVLLYWPIHDLWMEPEGMQQNLTVHHAGWMSDEPVGKLAEKLRENGYSFDFVSDRMVKELSAGEGKIKATGGSYRAIVIPECRYMPGETLEGLAALLRAGATVIFEKAVPEDMAGLAKTEQDRKVFTAAKEYLQNNAKVSTRVCETMAGGGIGGEPMIKCGLQLIRRRIDGLYWYFIANQSAKTIDQWVGFSVPLTSAVCFNPMTGREGELAVRELNGESQAYLQLQPGESILVRGGGEKASDTANFKYLQPDGEAVTLQGQWQVEFIDGGPDLPKARSIEKLVSWTEFSDSATEAFAGTGRYSFKFELPERSAFEWRLDLGDVRESARIRVNGENAGVLFSLPFNICIGNLLRPGVNTLEIEVTNLSANRIAALEKSGEKWKVMSDINIVNINYKKFDPSVWEPVPSGLLGPVRLVPMRKKEL